MFINGIVLNNWYHVCFRGKDNKIDIFVNGAKVVSNYSTPNANTSTGKDFYVGSYAENNNTRFQDFRVYDGCLSDKEIYDTSKALCLHYTFDEVEEPTVNLSDISKLVENTQNLLTTFSYDPISMTRRLAINRDSQYVRYISARRATPTKTDTIYTISFEYKCNNQLNPLDVGVGTLS